MPLRDIAVILIVLLAIPASLMRPWVGILAWSWLGYMNPHKISWNIGDLPLAEIVAGATLLGLLLTRDRRSVPWTREMVILVLLALYFTITTLFSWYPEVSWPQWEKVMKIYLFTFVTGMLIYGRQRIRALLLVAILSIGFYGLKGGLFTLTTGGQYIVLGPPGSFIGGNTSLGLALCMIAPLAVVVARDEAQRWLRLGLYAVFWLSVIAIIGTYSRGSLLGLFVVMLALFWQYKGRMFVLAIVIIGAVVFAKEFIPEKWYERQTTTLEYEEDYSAMSRLQAWSVGFNIAVDRPLLGAGFNFEYKMDNERWLSYADFSGGWENRARAAHSIYFQVLGQHGFVAFGLFVVLLLGTFLRLHALARRRSTHENAWVGVYAKGMLISLLVFMISGAFLSLAYFDLFYMYVVLSAVLQREADAVKSGQHLEEQTFQADSDTDLAPAVHDGWRRGGGDN